MIAAFSIAAFVAGVSLLIVSSMKAIEYTIKFASKFNTSPLLIGLVMVSIGTDLPEVANSIMSCMAGHGDINVGDSMGSVLAQTTLVLAFIPFLVGGFKINRREILILGAFEVFAFALLLCIIQIGLTPLNALFLIATWPILIVLIMKIRPERDASVKHVWKKTDRSVYFLFMMAMVAFAGVALGSFVVVQSVISLSMEIGVPEYLISFFALGVSTSLPELGVDLEGIRKGHKQLVLGDIVGSCIFDSLVAVSVGPLLFVTEISKGIVLRTGLYILFVIIVVFLVLAFRKELDKKAGMLFIILYLASYLLFI